MYSIYIVHYSILLVLYYIYVTVCTTCYIICSVYYVTILSRVTLYHPVLYSLYCKTGQTDTVPLLHAAGRINCKPTA